MARYFTPLSPPPAPPDPYSELLSSLSRINTFNPPVQTCSTGWTFNGFYAGPTSIALLFYRLSYLYPDLQFKSQSLLDWARAYLDIGSHFLDPKRPTVDPSHCGVANETLCQLALQAVFTKDASLGATLCGYSIRINSNSTPEDGSNEWLYGRAGYLYLLRFVLKFFSNPSEGLIRNFDNAISSTISSILKASFPWKWHHKPYLGAVHGSIGIITQLLLSSSTHTLQDNVERLGPSLIWVLDEQLPSGNFPSSHCKTGDDRLVQFCHGSPGVVISLYSIRPFYKDDPEVVARMDDAIAKAQPDLLARGLLTKSPCLCHGIPTNALAITDETKMIEYLSYMSTEVLEGEIGEKLKWMSQAGRFDDFAGLYTGEAGRAWVWAMVDQMRKGGGEGKELGRGMIGFNDF